MRRMAIIGGVVGVVVLVVRSRGAKLHERVMANYEAMFDRMPDTFPPKRMMLGIDEIRDKTDRILALLQTEEKAVTPPVPEAGSDQGVHHAA